MVDLGIHGRDVRPNLQPEKEAWKVKGEDKHNITERQSPERETSGLKNRLN